MKLIPLLMSSLVCLQVWASEPRFDTWDFAQSLMQPQDGQVNLSQAKEFAAGENVDARIAYEKLYQAHQRIHQARANYFPYGAGDVAVLYYANFWNPLILAELATSLPSKWHNVQKEKRLRNAESYRLKALKENVKNQTARLYYGMLKEEALLAISGRELLLMEELAAALEVQVVAGFSPASELKNLRFAMLKARDQYLRLQGYLAEEKAILKAFFNLDHAAELEAFEPVPDELSNEDIVFDVESLIMTSLNRSYEAKAAQEMVYAASRSRSSEKWSILSFTGLGFDYMERVRFAGSKLREAVYQREALERNLESEALARERALRNAIAFADSEREIMHRSRRHMLSRILAFENGTTDINHVIDASLYFLQDFKKYVSAHYDSLARLDDLERIAMGNVGDVARGDERVEIELFGEAAELSIAGDFDGRQIQSVHYVFDQDGIRDVKLYAGLGAFPVQVPLGAHTFLSGSALVFFADGEVAKLPFELAQSGSQLH